MSDKNDFLENLKSRSVEILKEMKKTGQWNTTNTKEIFKLNNELQFQYETNYGCGDCVARVYERLVQYFKQNGIDI